MADIGFIGIGNIASSMITGIVNGGLAQKDIAIAGRNSQSVEALHSKYPTLQRDKYNIDVARGCRILFLCVKPKDMPALCGEIKNYIDSDTVVISVAAGLPIELIAKWTGSKHIKIVRMMPNTPISVSKGVVLVYGNRRISRVEQEELDTLFDTSALSIWLDKEDQMNAGTAVCGSGPAYFFYLVGQLKNIFNVEEAVATQWLIRAANQFVEYNAEIKKYKDSLEGLLDVQDSKIINLPDTQGSEFLLSFAQGLLIWANMYFNSQLAYRMVNETLSGAVELLLHKNKDTVEDLCRQVTSKGGTTESALNQAQALDFEAMFKSDMERMKRNNMVFELAEKMCTTAIKRAEQLAYKR